MNYNLLYEAIIEKARVRGKLPSGDREIHHVIPRCMGGSKGEVVHLLLREHYVCHSLLCKIYPEHYGLKLAYLMMCNIHEEDLGKRIKNSRMYQILKKQYFEFYRGENHPRYGKPGTRLGTHFTDETRKKLSEARKGIICGEKHPWFGRKHTNETKQKLSEIHKELANNVGYLNGMSGKSHTKETRDKIKKQVTGKLVGEKNGMFGRKHSDESKKIMSHKLQGRIPWNKGRKGIYSEETLKKMCEKSKKYWENKKQEKELI